MVVTDNEASGETGSPRTVRLTPEQIEAEVLRISRAGLPVRPETAGEWLPYLRVVAAHARGTDGLARVLGLDEVLTKLARRMPAPDPDAYPVLLGLPPAFRDWSWSKRMEEAAHRFGYNADHFRKSVVTEKIRDLAYELIRWDVKYRPQESIPLPPGEGLPTIDDLQPETAELLEVEARIFEHYFGMRADLVAVARLPARATTLREQHSVEALWHLAQLLTMSAHLADDFPGHLAEARRKSEAVSQVSAWRGPFSDEEAARLRRLITQHPTVDDFDAALTTDRHTVIRSKWLEWVAYFRDQVADPTLRQPAQDI